MRNRAPLTSGLAIAAMAASALAVTALSGCGAAPGESAAAAADEAPLVEVASVAPLAADGVVRASGLIGYRREAALSFTAAGSIADIWVDSGDRVRRGQRLASLRRTGPGANVSEAALARQNAERDLVRAQELFDRGFVSEARLDDARLAVERARDSSILTAPTDGIILRRSAERAQTVGAGTPVFFFGETNSGVVVRAPVASGAAARIRVGDAAIVQVREHAAAALTGRVSRVGAKGDDGTGAFEVEIEIETPGELRSGVVADVTVSAAPAPHLDNALLAPTLSLLDARADQGVVFVVGEDNIARRRAVRTAGVTDAGVLIVEGLTPGERIIAAGAAYARDGEPVRIANPDPS
jgi:RND family efflux transporter MFP subunit